MAFPESVKVQALTACGRHCCICHMFAGLKIELHHIQLASEGGKDEFDNAIPLCLDCHADQTSYDHKHPKGTKYSAKELRLHRDNWYEKMRNSPAVQTHYASRPADKAVFEKLLVALPWDGAMKFISENDFGGSFFRGKLDPVRNYSIMHADPTQQFLDADLEGLRADFVGKLDDFLSLIAVHTVAVGDKGGVLRLSHHPVPEQRRLAHDKLNEAADEVTKAYRALIIECRQRLS